MSRSRFRGVTPYTEKVNQSLFDRTGFEAKSSFLPHKTYEGTSGGENGDRKSRRFDEIREDLFLFIGIFSIALLCLFLRLFRFDRKTSVKKWCAAKRVPYTAKSNLASTRSSYHLLRAGALAAHQVNRLMLLGSPSDMVHSSRLRKTHLSTQRIGLNS